MKYLLFIASTSPLGLKPIYGQSVGERCVEMISEVTRDPFPCYNADNDPGVLTEVARAMPYNRKDFLFGT